MPSYVVTGASRGIGLEFVRQLGASPENKVFALVRNKSSAHHLLPLEGGNTYVLQADVTDHKALKAAAAKVAEVTGGTLDVLINNAAALARENDWRTLTDFEGEEDLLEQEFEYTFKVNVVGVIHSTNAFLPLLRKGTTKKVIVIGSRAGDHDFIYQIGLTNMAPYGASKGAVNIIVAKYAAQLKPEGFLFVSLSPGYVDVSATFDEKPSEKNLKANAFFGENMKTILPSVPRMITPTESVANQLIAIANLTEKDNGKFIRTNFTTAAPVPENEGSS